MNREILINGIDALTGRYLPAPGTDRELAEQAIVQWLSPSQRRQLRWWIDPTRRKKEDPLRQPIRGVDPLRLDSAGWAVIFTPETPTEVRNALKRLLKHRERQAGTLYHEHVGPIDEQTKEDFLALKKAPPGNPDPKAFPYYVLLVGDPRNIPFRFQYELDIQYAVGRLWLERPEDYERYANSVVDAEATSTPRNQRLEFFGVSNDDDRPTARLSKDLIEPLAQAFAGPASGWEVHTHLGSDARKENLWSLLEGSNAPALLFTGSHGLGFRVPEKDLEGIRRRQLADQGALICQDWLGPEKWKGEIPPEQYFAAADVPATADLIGLFAFLFACYSGGTPEHDSFADEPFGEPPRIASAPFIARLPQRLLSRGALAVIAHVDRAWTTSFSWSEASQPALFVSTLQSLLEGEPLGWAMEYLNMRHAELSVELSRLFQDQASLLSVNQERFSRVWRATNDVRNYTVLGDPAVRLRRPSP